MALARALSFWISVRSARACSGMSFCICSSSAKPRIACSGIVQLVRNPGHQHTDGGQPLLPNHLLLQRLQLFAHPPLVVDLRGNRGARLLQVGDHARHGFLQSMHFRGRHRLGLERGQVTAADALRGLVKMIECLQPAPSEHPRQHHDHHGGRDADPETALEDRPGAGHRHRYGDADAGQPRSALDHGIAEDPLDAVHAGQDRRRRDVERIAGTAARRGRSTDVLRSIEAPRHNHAVGVGQRHDGSLRERNRRQHTLERLEVHRQPEDADDRARRHDRVAQHDRVRRVARLAEHRADQGLAGGRNALQPGGIERALDRWIRRPGPRNRPAFGVCHQRVVQQTAVVDERGQHFARGVWIERSHAGVSRRGIGHGIRGFEVAVHVHDHGRRHRPGLRGELANVFVVGQARAVTDREINQNRQDDDDEKDLASERLGQCCRGLRRESYQPAGRISGSVAPASAKPAARSRQLSQ